MSVWTLPPGGVRPGASRWSAARAAGGPPRWTRRIARTIATAAAATLLGGAFSGSPKVNPLDLLAANAAGSPEQRALGKLLSGLSGGDTAGYVRKLERRVARNPRDAAPLTVLG